MTALRCLIWDVDGTLADTEEAHRQAFNAAFVAAGLAWHWDVPLYRELLKIGGGKERLRQWLAATHPTIGDLDGTVKRLHADKTARYQAIVDAGAIPLRLGVARLIGEARAAGLGLAVATTTTRGNVDGLLGGALGADLLAQFTIAAGDCVAAKKPAPDVYRWLLDRLGLAASSCLTIEDSEIGLASARAAGVPCVVTLNDWTRGGAFEGALRVVENLDGIGLDRLRAWHGTICATPTCRRE